MIQQDHALQPSQAAWRRDQRSRDQQKDAGRDSRAQATTTHLNGHGHWTGPSHPTRLDRPTRFGRFGTARATSAGAGRDSSTGTILRPATIRRAGRVRTHDPLTPRTRHGVRRRASGVVPSQGSCGRIRMAAMYEVADERFTAFVRCLLARSMGSRPTAACRRAPWSSR